MLSNEETMLSNEDMQQRMQEIHDKHAAKLAAEWDIQKDVQFSMRELNMMRAAVSDKCAQGYDKYGKEDPLWKTLRKKLDQMLEDIEVEIRDREEPEVS